MYITRHLLALAVFASIALPGMAQKPQPEKIISGPVVEQATATDATIVWTTNTGGSFLVKYGTSPNNLTQIAESPYTPEQRAAANPVHRVQLRGLLPNTLYYYQVVSAQGQSTGISRQGKVGQFRTSLAGPQSAGDEKIIAGPIIEQVTNNSATIAWQTNVGGSSAVRYGIEAHRLLRRAESPYVDNKGAPFQVHRVQLNNLKPNTTYYYMVISGQGQGTETMAQSSVQQFKTK